MACNMEDILRVIKDQTMPVIHGIDLGAGRSPSAITTLEPEIGEYRMRRAVITTGDPALHIGDKPSLILVDAPITSQARGLRGIEKALARCTGTPLLPLGTPGMTRLRQRANKLCRKLAGRGHIVVETYPAATARVLGVRRPRGVRRHLADSVLAAVSGVALVRGEAVVVYGRDEGLIVVTGPFPYYRGLYERLLAAAEELLHRHEEA